MKKVVVFSDNHGDQEAIEIIKENESDADYFIHLGDSCAYDKQILEGCIAIRGNNDWALSDLPNAARITIEGLNILMTHGQFYGYYDRETYMIEDLENNDCTVLLSGHTHMPSIQHIGDYWLINPGSTSLPRGGYGPSYAILHIDGTQMEAEIVDFVRGDEDDEEDDNHGFFSWLF